MNDRVNDPTGIAGAERIRKNPDTMEELKGERLYLRHTSPWEVENRLNEALNCFACVLERQPDSTAALSGMARGFLKLGDYAKAARFAQKRLERPDPDPQAHYEAAYVLSFIAYRQGDLKEAARACQRAIRLGGLGSARAHLLSSLIGRAEMTRSFGQALWQLPCGLFHMLAGCLLLVFDRERMPVSVLLLLLPRLVLAWMLETLDMNRKALAQYEDIYERFPGLPMIGVALGRLHRREGQWEDARRWFENSVQRHPDRLEGYYHLARLLEDQEDYEAMAGIYEALLRLKPDDAYLHCHLANARYYLHDFAGALTHYEAALHLGEDSRWKAMIAQSIANIYCDCLENPDAAIAYYRMARELDCADPENDIRIGLLYFRKGDYGNAERVYRRALKESPRSARLYSNLGYLRWMDDDADEAIACYEKAIRLDPEYEIPINNLGVIYLDMLGNVPKAIDLFRRAIELDPDYALAHYNLGRAYSFLDSRLKAAHCFQLAQEANQRSQELDSDDLSDRIRRLFDLRGMELSDG